MAGSRLPKLGTIYSRMDGLLRTGAVKDRPLWLDVYEAFPPKRDPDMFNPIPESPIKPIFYPEDKVRAEFYLHVRAAPIVFDLKDNSFRSASQIVVEKFEQVKKGMTNAGFSQIFNETIRQLNQEGVHFEKDKKDDEREARKPPKSKEEKGKIDVSEYL